METKEYYGGTYPEPFDFDYKHVKANVYISFDLDFDIEREWDKERIIDYIKENLDDFTWYDEEIHEVVIKEVKEPNE